MKAAAQHRYGGPDTLVVEEIDEPTPGRGEVLVRVRACALNAADWHLMRAHPFPVRFVTGLLRPRVPAPGSALAGVVERVGEGVSGMAVGDEVMAEAVRGGLAELAVVKASLLVAVPAGVGLQRAATLPISATTALQALRDKGRVQAGERVLVIGAGGGVGTAAVQIATALGAQVVAVTRGASAELVRSLGAVEAVDYTTTDVAALGARFDVVVDVVGDLSMDAAKGLLAPGGRYVGVALGTDAGLGRVVSRNLAVASARGADGRSLTVLAARNKADDLAEVARLAAEGLLAPPVERTYALAEAADAMRHLETGGVRGKLVVTI